MKYSRNSIFLLILSIFSSSLPFPFSCRRNSLYENVYSLLEDALVLQLSTCFFWQTRVSASREKLYWYYRTVWEVGINNTHNIYGKYGFHLCGDEKIEQIIQYFKRLRLSEL